MYNKLHMVSFAGRLMQLISKKKNKSILLKIIDFKKTFNWLTKIIDFKKNRLIDFTEDYQFQKDD